MIITTHNFDQITDSLIESAETFSFNLNDLPDVYEYTYNRSIMHHDKFKDLFSSLNAKQNSCLYWFELEKDIDCKSLIELLNSVRQFLLQQEDKRVVPVRNKNIEGKYLYVGIRRGGYTKKWELSNISGRIVQHFGYYYKGSTQGLQLAHWAASSNLNLKLNVIQFEKGFPNEYLEAFEKILAHRLKPLCGKH